MDKKTEQGLIEKALFHFGQLMRYKVENAYFNEERGLFIVEFEVDDEGDFFNFGDDKTSKVLKVGYSFEEKGLDVIVKDFRIVKGLLAGLEEFNTIQLFRGYTGLKNILVDMTLNYEINSNLVYVRSAFISHAFHSDKKVSFREKPDKDFDFSSSESLSFRDLKKMSDFENFKQHAILFKDISLPRLKECDLKIVYDTEENLVDEKSFYLDDFFTIRGSKPNSEILHLVFKLN